ncbi:MAG TPA: lipoate--protein ligase family protein [Spirochaetales bacterium]|nr:lipoate--protein ligase family protein [Spirochaetales bacterium]
MSLTYKGAFRLILQPPMEGRRNMAIDEALLLKASEEDIAPVLRLYGFSPPTLSLGRFQRLGGMIDRGKIERNGITLVRRPTGGQAVLHDQELTYAVILSRAHIEPFSKRAIYRFISSLLLEGLRALNIGGAVIRHRIGTPHNPDCFRTSAEYEIAGREGNKLIGSAQVLTRSASLQHGSIPLNSSYTGISSYIIADQLSDKGEKAGEKPASLESELGRSISFSKAVSAFTAGFRKLIRIEESDLNREEMELAEELYLTKYLKKEWNLKL